MNQKELESLNLDSLPYPMFKTTLKEKKCLLEVLPLITDEDCNYFLCHILERSVGGDTAFKLKTKVGKAVGEHYTLSDYLGLGCHRDDVLHAELRRIWIRKLLAYKPEQTYY